ncbi:MAG: NAD(P)H-dependent oxidoreductase subunit E [Candidatus Firestonebacteria bacterium]|nr:NAD(P)H-dependent oxidoreductase subunit E [Candidatus Firestonebacteria bacterium]
MHSPFSSLAPARKFEKVCSILDQHGRHPGKLIPILQATQDEYRYLPEEVLHFIATSLNISPAQVFGVATFYSHFALQPKGKHVVKICDGTACHVKKSTALLDALCAALALGAPGTSADMLFTLETVSCLGACGIAPVVVINETVYGEVTPEKARQLIADLKAEEANHEN